MSIQRLCDYCRQSIDGDALTLTVEDFGFRLAIDKKGKIQDPPPSLTIRADLHRECYIEHFQTVLEILQPTTPETEVR